MRGERGSQIKMEMHNSLNNRETIIKSNTTPFIFSSLLVFYVFLPNSFIFPPLSLFFKFGKILGS